MPDGFAVPGTLPVRTGTEDKNKKYCQQNTRRNQNRRFSPNKSKGPSGMVRKKQGKQQKEAAPATYCNDAGKRLGKSVRSGREGNKAVRVCRREWKTRRSGDGETGLLLLPPYSRLAHPALRLISVYLPFGRLAHPALRPISVYLPCGRLAHPALRPISVSSLRFIRAIPAE